MPSPTELDRNPDIIGAPVDRTDGRLKVTGGARYSAEIALPGLTHGVLITSTIADGTVASMDTAAAEKAPGVLAVFTPFNHAQAAQAAVHGRGQQPRVAPAPAVAGQRGALFSAAHRRGGRRHPRTRHPRRGTGESEVRRGQTHRRAGLPPARRLQPRPQRRRRKSEAHRHLGKRSRGRAQFRARARRGRLPDPDGEPQPDGAARHHRHVGGRPPHALRLHAGRLRRAEPRGGAVRPARRQRARDLPLRRRRLRLQGLGLGSRPARGHVRKGGQAPRQDRAGTPADVQQHRLPRPHLPVVRRRGRQGTASSRPSNTTPPTTRPPSRISWKRRPSRPRCSTPATTSRPPSVWSNSAWARPPSCARRARRAARSRWKAAWTNSPAS